MAYFRPMCALGETSLLSVFHDLQLCLGRRCALDIQHLTVQLPGRVPVGERYSLLDLYFACAAMDFFFLHRRTSTRHCRSTTGNEIEIELVAEFSLKAKQTKTTKTQTQTKTPHNQNSQGNSQNKVKRGETTRPSQPLKSSLPPCSKLHAVQYLDVSHIYICT